MADLGGDARPLVLFGPGTPRRPHANRPLGVREQCHRGIGDGQAPGLRELSGAVEDDLHRWSEPEAVTPHDRTPPPVLEGDCGSSPRSTGSGELGLADARGLAL